MVQLSSMYESSVVLLTMISAALSTSCPSIHIKMVPQNYQCRNGQGCPQRTYCQDGYYCKPCDPCPDPYRLAEQGITELLIRAACYNSGSCPNACSYNTLTPKANGSLCDCVGVMPPPPEPTTIVCKEGCAQGDCNRTGECICESGWEGELCDRLECTPTCANGHCNVSSGECVCRSEWGGSICDQDLRYCSTNQPCHNGGTCVDINDGCYTCQCVEEFTGINCESATNLHLCEESCMNSGTCWEAEVDVYQCRCQEGFTGTNCQEEAIESTPWPGWMYVLTCFAVMVVIGVAVILYCCCRKLHIRPSWKYIWPFTDSDVELISYTKKSGKALPFDLSGNKVTLQDLHKWRGCVIHTCPCLQTFPTPITDGMNELPISDLQPGFTYTFEICRQARDAEESGVCVTSCEVLVPGFGNEDEVCTETMILLENCIGLRKSLDRILADSNDLRQCISGFFQFDERHSEAFMKPGDESCSDMLCDILKAIGNDGISVDSLLSHVAKVKPDRAVEFIQKLARSHSGCKVCRHINHHMHGVTEWAKQHHNQVAQDSSSHSTSVSSTSMSV